MDSSGFFSDFVSLPPGVVLLTLDVAAGPRRREALLGGGPVGVPVCAVRAEARSVRHVRGRNEEEAQQHQAVSHKFHVVYILSQPVRAYIYSPVALAIVLAPRC